MTDRRNRALIRCQVKGCIHVGPWDAAVPFCPGHIDDARSNWRAAVARATATPEPTTPLDTARTLLGGSKPERNTP